MEKLIIFLTIALCGARAISFDESGPSRITSGQEAGFNIFPYSVSIQRIADVALPHRGHICGGALITFQHVLTAATCWFDFIGGAYVQRTWTDYRVFSGASMLNADGDLSRVRAILNVTIHPEYLLPPSHVNDIAVITLQQPFGNTTVSPIALPVSTFNPPDFTLCQIASWGAQHSGEYASNMLRYTNKFIYRQNLCEQLYNIMPGHPNIMTSMVCAASFDIISSGCHGDVGIPLACNGGLTGILIETNRCASSSFPEVYTRVSNYTSWIRSISGSSTFRPELTFFGILVIAFAMLMNKA